MSLHMRETIFGFGAIPKIPPIKAVQDKCSAARRLDANVSALEFFLLSSLCSLSALPASDPLLCSVNQPVGPWLPTREFGRPEYCGIGRGGLFSKILCPSWSPCEITDEKMILKEINFYSNLYSKSLLDLRINASIFSISKHASAVFY